MLPILLIIALVTLGSAAVALTMRNIIHAALLLVVSWAGIAAFYLWAGAEFIAFAQVLVYVGAISMVVLFAVVLTRRAPMEAHDPHPITSMRSAWAVAAAGLVGLVITGAIISTPLSTSTINGGPTANMRMIGLDLMSRYAGAVLIVGALLTVALLGAVILAAQDKNSASDNSKNENEETAQ